MELILAALFRKNVLSIATQLALCIICTLSQVSANLIYFHRFLPINLNCSSECNAEDLVTRYSEKKYCYLVSYLALKLSSHNTSTLNFHSFLPCDSVYCFYRLSFSHLYSLFHFPKKLLFYTTINNPFQNTT